jgi:hypothetical protein
LGGSVIGGVLVELRFILSASFEVKFLEFMGRDTVEVIGGQVQDEFVMCKYAVPNLDPERSLILRILPTEVNKVIDVEPKVRSGLRARDPSNKHKGVFLVLVFGTWAMDSWDDGHGMDRVVASAALLDQLEVPAFEKVGGDVVTMVLDRLVQVPDVCQEIGCFWRESQLKQPCRREG